VKALLLAASLVVPSVAAAHEIGTTDVHVTIHRDDTWSAVIRTGPESLLNKLEAAAAQPRSRDLDASALRAALEPRLSALARQIDLRFDDERTSPATLSILQLEVPPDIMEPAFIVVSATGAVPGGATHLTWSYSLAYSTYALRLDASDEPRSITVWLDGDSASTPLPLDGRAPPTRPEIVDQYLRLGFLHILPQGLDHVLFVLGLCLLTTAIGPLLVQVTAFTLAHSLTLGLTMYGLVSLSPRVVEPLIAASIVYVAIENVVARRLTPWRLAVVFAFGLLHGLGFADVLKDLGLPAGEFIPALVSFNVGIEFAQLAVIAAAFLGGAVWYRRRPWYRTRVVVPASALIALTGMLWTVQRVAAP
jgi:hydrogenase/urease accessory protein HupE